ncbi:MAG TPA: DUF1127 domain-containing protein [Rhodopila sp.]|nr:DUF1127 domain-containing protein [Rhodopila sp.]
MASVYQDSIAHGSFNPTQGLGAWFSRRLAAYAERRRHAREIADLAAYSDHDLWDLGLSRSDLMSIERGTFRRD